MTDAPKTEKELVNKLDPKYFFFELPLYENIDISQEEKRMEAIQILGFLGEFNAYNFNLKENTTFAGDNYKFSRKLSAGYIIEHIVISCKRTEAEYNYYVAVSNSKITKIGQYPSLADLNIGQIKEYRDVLSKEKLAEFIRGIGLRAHGVGIGSFVYLRRIFEYLIEEEHKKAKTNDAWDEDSYVKERMDEKIKMLSNHLPEFLVENKDLYGILSKGVHELSEEECLKYFDAVKLGIEEILEEKVAKAEKKKRREAAKKSLNLVRNDIVKK